MRLCACPRQSSRCRRGRSRARPHKFASVPAASRCPLRFKRDRSAAFAARFGGTRMGACPLTDDGGRTMRVVSIILCTMLSTAAAAQEDQSRDRLPGDSPHSTGRSYQPTEGQNQPQGNTGPLETTTGGAPAESPQGQSPLGMQPAPEGSSKTIVDPAPARP